MGATWKKKAKPEIILRRISKIASINDEGRLMFSGFDIFEIEPQLHAIIDYGGQYSFDTKKRFRDRALLAYLNSNEKSKESFIKFINKEISIYKAETDHEFILTTSISINGHFPIRKLSLPAASIQFFPNGLPKKYSARSIHDARWSELFNDKDHTPKQYTSVTVKVKAKNTNDALDLALDNLDFIRGVIGILVNPGAEFSITSGATKQKPINKIMLGGMHTIHRPDGKLVTNDQFWYESNYQQIPPTTIKEERKDSVSAGIRKLISGIANFPSQDRDLLTSSITRYARALDDKDRNAIIQKLWSSLESLLAKGESNADGIVRRCSFLYKERDYTTQILEIIREYRNKSIHTGATEEKIDPLCYQLHRFFRDIIYFYSNSSKFFNSIDEANSFLDLSHSEEKINADLESSRRRTKILMKAKKFISNT